LAYTNTTFCAQTPLGEIRLRIGIANSLLAQLLSQFAVDEWAFITSYNPGSQALPEDENTQRQIELKDRLQKDGFQIFSGEGKGDDSEWPPEPSFLVLGVNKNHAIAIGKDFGQNAIVAGGKDAIPILKWAAVAT